ncbi:MAG: hypothetical protein HY722_14410 [Planctomycetes bacterium]|nr:hypothetical protein [Planctomycetota bacterium]
MVGRLAPPIAGAVETRLEAVAGRLARAAATAWNRIPGGRRTMGSRRGVGSEPRPAGALGRDLGGLSEELSALLRGLKAALSGPAVATPLDRLAAECALRAGASGTDAGEADGRVVRAVPALVVDALAPAVAAGSRLRVQVLPGGEARLFATLSGARLQASWSLGGDGGIPVSGAQLRHLLAARGVRLNVGSARSRVSVALPSVVRGADPRPWRGWAEPILDRLHEAKNRVDYALAWLRLPPAGAEGGAPAALEVVYACVAVHHALASLVRGGPRSRWTLTPLATVLHEVTEALRPRAQERSVRLQLRRAARVPPLAMDRDAVRSLVDRAARKALEAAPRGSTVTISAGRDRGRGTVRVRFRQAGTGRDRSRGAAVRPGLELRDTLGKAMAGRIGRPSRLESATRRALRVYLHFRLGAARVERGMDPRSADLLLRACVAIEARRILGPRLRAPECLRELRRSCAVRRGHLRLRSDATRHLASVLGGCPPAGLEALLDDLWGASRRSPTPPLASWGPAALGGALALLESPPHRRPGAAGGLVGVVEGDRAMGLARDLVALGGAGGRPRGAASYVRPQGGGEAPAVETLALRCLDGLSRLRWKSEVRAT